jgi:hypothetical protein
MATITGQRNRSRRGHLTLVPPLDQEPTVVTVRSVEDPEPGPRDAAELADRFSHLLPSTSAKGAFSLGIV